MRLPRHSAEYHGLGSLCIGAIVPTGTLPPELTLLVILVNASLSPNHHRSDAKKHRFSNSSLQREPRHRTKCAKMLQI
jgi:hypothetical protein